MMMMILIDGLETSACVQHLLAFVQSFIRWLLNILCRKWRGLGWYLVPFYMLDFDSHLVRNSQMSHSHNL